MEDKFANETLPHFKWQFRSLHLLGTFLIPEKNTKVNRLKSLIQILSFPWGMLPFLYSAVKAYPDIGVICGFMGVALGYVISITKMYPFHFQYKHFERIFMKIMNLDGKLKPEERVHFNKLNSIVEVMTIVNGVSLAGGSVFFLIFPVLLAFVQFLMGKSNVHWPTPFDCVFPFDISDLKIYGAMYLFMSYFTIMIAIIGNAIDSTFLEASLIVAAHFKILEDRLRKIDFKHSNWKNNLIELFKYHKEILEMVDTIRNAYKIGLPSYLMVASALICAMIFTVKTVDVILDFIIFAGFATSCFCQVFFYAFGGQSMEKESERIIFGIYSSNWFEATPKQRKFILPFMIRAQQKSLITVLFYNINLQLFLKIAAGSFSYVMMLQSLMNYGE